MFGLPRHTMKGKCHDFIYHKQRNQLQQVQYRWYILKLKYQKTIERQYFQTSKQTANKVPLLLLHIKALTEKQELHFWTLPTNKVGTVYVFSF